MELGLPIRYGVVFSVSLCCVLSRNLAFQSMFDKLEFFVRHDSEFIDWLRKALFAPPNS